MMVRNKPVEALLESLLVDFLAPLADHIKIQILISTKLGDRDTRRAARWYADANGVEPQTSIVLTPY